MTAKASALDIDNMSAGSVSSSDSSVSYRSNAKSVESEYDSDLGTLSVAETEPDSNSECASEVCAYNHILV